MSDKIEFYKAGTDELIDAVESSMIPREGQLISIRGETWKVICVTLTIDYSGHPVISRMRCNVDLKRLGES